MQLSKYKEEYCDMLIKHMAEGFSFESFASNIGVHRDTLYEWTNVHECFSDAKKIGTAKNLFYWEKMGIGMASGKQKSGSPGVWSFNMKNRHGWTDKTEVSGGINVVNLKYNLEDDED